jgi:N,N'-diacetyllegionaminate synthase
MRIGSFDIGGPPYIIAELGVNHDGSPERAIELVRMAAAAGADAVKFQVFRADLLMSLASRLAEYQAAAGEADPVEMLRRLELPLEALGRAVEEAHGVGVHAIATVFSVELVAPAQGLGFDAYKTASPDIIHRPLLEALVLTRRPLILSTGASTLQEVARALTWLRTSRARIALLQCVSAYPTPVERASLGGIAALKTVHRGPVGYSDHTTSEQMGALAVAAGACILEKHFTYNRSAPGPDHGASLEPDQFARYAAGARAAYASVGPRTREVLDIERDVRTVSRQSIVAVRPISAGVPLSRHDVAFKRPGTGLPPWMIDAVVGRAARRDLPADTPVREDDLVPPTPPEPAA